MQFLSLTLKYSVFWCYIMVTSLLITVPFRSLLFMPSLPPRTVKRCRPWILIHSTFLKHHYHLLNEGGLIHCSEIFWTLYFNTRLCLGALPSVQIVLALAYQLVSRLVSLINSLAHEGLWIWWFNESPHSKLLSKGWKVKAASLVWPISWSCKCSR